MKYYSQYFVTNRNNPNGSIWLDSIYEKLCQAKNDYRIKINLSGYSIYHEYFDDESGTIRKVEKQELCQCCETKLARTVNDQKTKKTTQEIENRLENYPILDEMDYSNRQFEAQCEFWASISLRERMEMCKENNISIFAARHKDSLPDIEFSSIY